MDKIEINVDGLANAIGIKDAGAFKEAIKQEGANIEEIVKSEVLAKISIANKQKEDAYSRGKRETAEAFEKKIAEKLEVEVGDIDAMFSSYSAKKADPKAKLDADTVRNNEIYLADMKAKIAEFQTKESEFQKTIASYQEKESLNTLMKTGEGIIKDDVFVLPTNAIVKENQLKTFFSQLHSEFDFKDGKAFDKKGNPVKDDHLNDMDIDTLVAKRAENYFDKKQGDGRKAPDNGGADGKKADQIVVGKFKDSNDFYSQIHGERDLNKLNAMQKQYEAQVESGEIK